MIFSMVDEPPSWSDIDNSLELMLEPDEEEDDDEEDMPEDKDSSLLSGISNKEVHVKEREDEDRRWGRGRGRGSVTGLGRARPL